MIELPNDALHRKLIKNELQAKFSTAKTFWQIASLIIQNQDKIGIGNHRTLNLCLAAVFAKQMRLYVVAYRLCEQGLGNEALLALRAMFATFINLTALERSNDRIEYARLWIIWDLANDNKQVPFLLQHHPEAKARTDEFQQGIDAEKVKMSPEDWKNFVKNGPSKLDLASLAQTIQHKEAYDIFYRFASGPAHGYDLLFYATPRNDEGFTINLPPSLDLVDSSLVTAMLLLRDSLAALNVLLSLKKDKEVEELTSLVKALGIEEDKKS